MMHISCPKDTLIDGLNLVGRTVSNRTTLPILECVLLTADENGLKLTANDLEMSIETNALEADIRVAGKVALEAKLFSEIVRKMPGDVIEIRTDANHATQCASGKAKFTIFGMPGDEFPVMPRLEKEEGYTLPARFLRDMIRQTIFSVALDDFKPILTGELIQYKDNTLHMVAVDGFRIAYRRLLLESGNAPMSVVAPAKTLHELSRIMPGEGDDLVTYYFTDKRIVFELPRFTFVSRLLEGSFIRYEQIFNEDFTTIVTIGRVALLTGLERACLIARDSRKSSVRLDIQEDAVVITSNTEMGISYDEIPADIDGQQLVIAFNPRYLIEALRAVDEEQIMLTFNNSLSPCILKGVINQDFKYLILPLRTV